MQVNSAATATRYYQNLPPADHAPGDIWMRLPRSGGPAGAPATSGLVITPACNLANDKTDTITYLPVVSVWEYFGGPAGYSLLRPPLIDTLGALGRQDLKEFLPRGRIPTVDDLDLLRSEVSVIAGKAAATARVVAGLDAIAHILSRTPNQRCITECLGEPKLIELLKRVVTNGYADDVHFLPPDEQPAEWSAIPRPAVVLFRYPSTQLRGWFDVHVGVDVTEASPLKTLRLRNDFLTDLLTRFTRLYVRLGSPDFSEDAVAKMVKSIKEPG